MYTVADEERLQLAQLLSMRHSTKKTPRAQRALADVWVRYVYLLLERTSSLCQTEGVRFEDLKQHEQALLLRCQANELRALCGLPASDVLCDPEDALRVVQRLTFDGTLSTQHGLQATTSEIVSIMRTKYSTLLHTTSVCRKVFTQFSFTTLLASFLPFLDPGASGTNTEVVYQHPAPEKSAKCC